MVKKSVSFLSRSGEIAKLLPQDPRKKDLRSSVLSFASCDGREACHTHRLNREGIYSFFFMGLRRLAMPSGSRKS